MQELNFTLFSKITAWLADAGNGIANIFVGEINANDANIKNLCVTNNSGKTCITRDQLDALLNNANVVKSSVNNSTNTEATSTLADTTSPIIMINGENPAKIIVGSIYSAVDSGNNWGYATRTVEVISQ